MSEEHIKPGYKRTEVGVIPEDWDVKNFSDHFQIYAGGDVPKHSFSEIRSESYPYPIFANATQNKGLYGFTNEHRAKKGSLTITARGYIGYAEYRNEDFFPIVRLLVLEPNGSLDAQFTTYAVNNQVTFAFESTGVPQLTAPQIGKYSVAAPSIKEQRAITTALLDMDALLAQLDQLIAKKRDLKQATMQQLLTGQTRLPGFSGAWQVKRLGDVANLYQPTTISASVFSKDGFPVYGANGIVGYYHNFNHEDSQVTITCRGSTCGTVNKTLGKAWITGNAMVVNCDGSNLIEKDFLYQLLMNQDLTVCITGSGQPQIIRGPLEKFEIYIPTNRKEQTAIATIFSDMDAELATLQARRDKTHALKQGMMQELLTGRIRLV